MKTFLLSILACVECSPQWVGLRALWKFWLDSAIIITSDSDKSLCSNVICVGPMSTWVACACCVV